MINDENKKVISETTGLPIVSEEQSKAAAGKGKLMPIFMIIVGSAIGYGIAYAIYALGDNTKFDARIAMAKELDL